MHFRHIALFLSLFVSSEIAWAGEWRTCPEQGVQTFLGLDDTSAPTQVRDARARDLQNVLLDVSQSLTKRRGIKVVGNTCDEIEDDFPPITSIYYTKFSSSGTERIIRTCNDNFQYLNGETWTDVVSTPGTSGPVVITEGANNQFVWTSGLDNIIGTNDVDAPIQYDGTTLTVVDFTDMPSASWVQQAKTVAFFKNYLIFANTVELGVNYPTRLRWSNVGTLNDWTEADRVDIGALGGQEINALAELYDNLYVFLTDSIYKLSLVGGADTWNVSKVTDDIGAIAKNGVQGITLANAQNGIVFLDKDKKVYFFNGTYAQDISLLISGTMKNLTGSRLPYAVSADTGTDYWLCVNDVDASQNDLCLDLQYQIGEWTKHTNIKANAMASVTDSSSNPQVYFGDYYGLTYQLQDSTLRSDVGFVTGTVDSVSTYTTATASGLQVLYDNSVDMITGVLVGAPILLTAGTGSIATGIVVDNTVTGLVVANAFLTTPDSTTQFEVGGIDSFYTTKWYDLTRPAQLKHFGEIYFWADADVTSTHTLSYATDYNADWIDIAVQLTPEASNVTWGSDIWGVTLFGKDDTVFRSAKMESQGRFFSVKWADDDSNEIFHIYGWNCLYKAGDVN